MTELAIREPQDGADGGPITDLVRWAEEARQAASIAVSLAKTAFVPASLRGRSDDVTAAQITAVILAGKEVRLAPMASLRSIDIIQGTPAMRALTMRALVQSAGHEVWEEQTGPDKVVMHGQRRDSDKVHVSTWTMERARRLGLHGKDNWLKQPEAMLVARATAEVCRKTAADVLLGLAYSAEELQDQGEAEPAAPRTARRRPLAAVAETPAAEAAPVEPPPTGALLPGEDLEPDLSWPEITPPGADAS